MTVVTLFSAAAPPHTRAARTFLRQCKAADAATLFAERRAEDVAVLDGLGVRHVHLNHPDALFRRRADPSGVLRRAGRLLPELDHRYPTFRFDIDLGRVSRGDRQLRDRHADRLLARAVGEHLRVVLYADFPYTARDPAVEAAAGELQPWAWMADLAAKAPVIAGYRMQVEALFPGGEIPVRPETYYPCARDHPGGNTTDPGRIPAG